MWFPRWPPRRLSPRVRLGAPVMLQKDDEKWLQETYPRLVVTDGDLAGGIEFDCVLRPPPRCLPDIGIGFCP